MLQFFKKILSFLFILIFLNACVSSGKNYFNNAKEKLINSNNSDSDVGEIFKEENDNQVEQYNETFNPTRKLNIIIPAFDPGIKDNKEVFQELRNFESKRFAVKLKNALETTNKVGAVRVTPNTSASGQIYIIGKIIESNGQKVNIKIKVIDTSGKKLMDKKFSKKIKHTHYSSSRTKNNDAYDKLFNEVALKIVERLKKLDEREVDTLVNISKLRFGTEFSSESFTSYLKKSSNKYTLTGLPSDNDPMWQRVNSIMIREQLFIDSLQSHYNKFVNSSNQSYILWQSQSYNEIVAEKKAKTKAIGRGVLGVLSIAAAVASASSPNNNDDYTNEVGLLTLGGKLFEDAAKYKAEAKMHRDSIEELGYSIDAELAPNIIEFENKTIELSGNAKQQFLEWRNFLKKMYELEKTPNIQL